MKYLIGVIGAVILTVVAILLITNRGSSPNPSESAKKRVTLTEYIRTGTEARYTVDGPVNAEEKHRQIQITVSEKERNIKVFKGYEFEIDRTQRFDNDQAAYRAFMYALNNAGFANENQRALQKDKSGVCPLGNRYTYELLDSSERPVDLWSTSCDIRQGTFAGNSSLVRTLFQNQIPDYTKFVQGVGLR